MMRQFTFAIMVACMAGSAAGAQATASPPSAREPEITASGRGEVHLAPTYAVVTVNITTRATTAAEAASQNAPKVDATLKALQGAGLSDKDISTSEYSLQQHYEYPPNRQPQPAGFVASTTIRAEVRRLKDLGRVMDAAIAAGATGIGGIQFLASNTDEARRAAMNDAVRQAKADADVIARAAGGSLGRLISLNSGSIPQPVGREIQMRGADMARVVSGSAGTSIVPGELNITATVFGRWEFLPGPSR
jgi:uncharacterized protein